ncbi:hypothetical protein T492DRAFT_1118176 [Pavlovales sp. CCMP2436]|nr:hypothetical protein T492DRAFT_1118176 [Pavlovales sp. CCMP2436]
MTLRVYRRVAGFGARALPVVQRFGNAAGEYLYKGSAIGARVAKLARSGLDAIEKSDLGRIPGVGELVGFGRDVTNFIDMASRPAGRHESFAAQPTTGFYKLEIKWATQTNWGTFVNAPSALSGCTVSDIKFHISQVRLDGAVERAMMDSLGGIVHCPTLDYSHFRSTVAPNAGFISMQIPIRVSQACNIFVVLRESAITNEFSRKMISQRTKAGMIDYRFRVGATVITQTAINCTGSAAEARFELARTFGSGVADASARSSISAEQFLTDGYAVGLSLQAFPQTDALSDGISTRNMHVVFESKISASNPACYLDVWVQPEWADDLRGLNHQNRENQNAEKSSKSYCSFTGVWLSGPGRDRKDGRLVSDKGGRLRGVLQVHRDRTDHDYDNEHSDRTGNCDD